MQTKQPRRSKENRALKALAGLLDQGKETFERWEYGTEDGWLGGKTFRDNCLRWLVNRGYVISTEKGQVVTITEAGKEAIKEWRLMDLQEEVKRAQQVAASAYARVEQAQKKLFNFQESR